MSTATAWTDAVTAALVFAVDPVGIGGVLLRARAGPVRQRWLEGLRAVLPPQQALRSLPLHIADGRLLGGLDLNATLLSGRPVAERGLLAEVDGGVLLLAMAERLPQATQAHVTAAMDAGETRVERDGLSLRLPARFGVVALDEAMSPDERIPSGLADRLAFYLDLGDVQVIARLSLNGKDLGILWKPPYCTEITVAAHPGDNHLEIQVTNLWPNRIIGDEQLPEDSDRDPSGAIKSWPQWLRDGKPSPTGRFTFATFRHWKKSDPLFPSGLIGPVTLRPTVELPLP